MYSTFHEAYINLLKKLLNEFQFETSPRGQKTREILNYSFVVQDPRSYIEWDKTGTPERQKTVEKYWEKELAWYKSGSLKKEDTPSKFWHTLADEDGNVTSNYGHMVLHEPKYLIKHATEFYSEGGDYTGDNREWATGVEKVIKTLTEDPDSRQAMIHYGESRHFWVGNKDTPCCITNQFFIRDNALHMVVNMRSNDAILGITYDYLWFRSLMEEILLEVSGNLAATGNKKTIRRGHIYYNIGSLHLYEKDFELAKKIIG